MLVDLMARMSRVLLAGSLVMVDMVATVVALAVVDAEVVGVDVVDEVAMEAVMGVDMIRAMAKADMVSSTERRNKNYLLDN